MADPGKLSASKITTYKGCSMAYYLRYVEHEKVPTNGRFVFGKSMHYMIERFYKYNYKSPQSFANFFKRYWFMQVSGENLKGKAKRELETIEVPTGNGKSVVFGDHVDLGQYRDDVDSVGLFFGYMKLGESILKKFYKRHIPEKIEDMKDRKPPVENEFGFGVRKAEPFEINGHPVRGYIDRIDKMKRTWYITDYKTDKKIPHNDSFTLHRHPQFTIYSYAFREIFGKKEKAILYYHLRTGKVLKTHRSEKDYDYLKKLLDDVSDGIVNDRFTPFYGFHCGFCDYKVACEKYSTDFGGPRIDLKGRIKGAEEFTRWDTEFEMPDEAEWMDMQGEDR